MAKRKKTDKAVAERAVNTLRDLLEDFPALDPVSRYYDDPVSGADVVQWLSEHACDMRSIIDLWDSRELIPEKRTRKRN